MTVEWLPYPRDGATVYFLRADDSVIDFVSTDPSGRAQALYDAPGSVVIQMGVGIPTWQQSLVAYLDVPPGTNIDSGSEATDRGGTVTVTGPVPDNPQGFGIETACGRRDATTPTVTITLQFCEPLLGHTRGYAAALADLESDAWFVKGEVGDLVTTTYGFNDVVE